MVEVVPEMPKEDAPVYWAKVLEYVAPPFVDISIVALEPAHKLYDCKKSKVAGFWNKLNTGVSKRVVIIPLAIANFGSGLV